MSKPATFNNLSDAIGAVNYIQSLLSAEFQWIGNRMSWLFISQSFCLSVYTILVTSTGIRFDRNIIIILNYGLPAFGILCCSLVGFAAVAASRVARSLSEERARIVKYINENSPATIPLSGFSGDLADKNWTFWGGELPHLLLPWSLVILWFLLMIV
jgi:hypothetical protein